MQQFLPSSILREFKTYEKISARMDQINSTAGIFGQYLKSTLTEYIDFSVEINAVCVSFEDDLIKSNLYSSGICDQLLPFSSLLREFCMNIRQMAEINLENLRWIKKQEAELYLGRFISKLHNFIKKFRKYCSEADSVATKVFKPYNEAVKSLDDSLKDLKEINNPLIFYNMEATKELSRELDAKYHSATERESEFKNSLEVLKESKKAIQVDMGETKTAATEFLTFQMGVIIKIIRHIVENRTWKGFMRKATIKDSVMEEQCASELAKLNSRYGSDGKRKRVQGQQEVISVNSFENPFVDDIDVNNINADERFFYERCVNYFRLKCNSSKCSNSFRQKFRDLLTCLSHKINKHQQRFEKAGKTPFGANKIQKYKKDLRKHFGPRISELFDILIEIIDRPAKTFNKLKKAINLRIDRIDKAVLDQKLNFESFEQEIKFVLEDHKKLKIIVENQNKIVKGEIYDKFKTSIQLTFLNIKRTIVKYEKSESSIHDRFMQEVSSVVEVLERECGKKMYADLQKLADDERLTATIDKQVAKAMNEDVKYTVMYDPFYLNPIENDFRSRIDSQTFMMTNKILTLREDMVTKQPRLSGVGGLCCVSAKTPQKSVFPCQVVDGKELLNGQLEVTSQGIKFTSEGGLFTSKLILIIPKSDILKCEMREQVTHMYFNAILIITQMGDIAFAGFDKLKEVYQLIKGRFQSKRESGNYRNSVAFPGSDSSSIMRDRDISHNLTPNTPNTQVRKVYRMPNELRPQLARMGSSITIKAVPSQLQLHSLIQEWFHNHNFFDKELFTIVKHSSTENVLACTYSGFLAGIKVTVKERKQVERSQNPPSIVFTYEWKVSFTENTNLPSFIKSLKIIVEMKNKAVYIKTSKPEETQTNTYLGIKFLQQLQKMVCSFSKFVAEHFHGTYEVFLDPGSLSPNRNLIRDQALQSVPTVENQIVQMPILENMSLAPNVQRSSQKQDFFTSKTELFLRRNSSSSPSPSGVLLGSRTLPNKNESPFKDPLPDIATHHSIELDEDPLQKKEAVWKKSYTVTILFTTILFTLLSYYLS